MKKENKFLESVTKGLAGVACVAMLSSCAWTKEKLGIGDAHECGGNGCDGKKESSGCGGDNGCDGNGCESNSCEGHGCGGNGCDGKKE